MLNYCRCELCPHKEHSTLRPYTNSNEKITQQMGANCVLITYSVIYLEQKVSPLRSQGLEKKSALENAEKNIYDMIL